MEPTKKSELIDAIASIEDADLEKSFVKLFIRMPSGELETISNPNVREKAKYIDKAYDDNLSLKTFPAIHIEDYEVHSD